MVSRRSFHRLLHAPYHSCDKTEHSAVGQMWGWKPKKSHTFCNRLWIWLEKNKQHRFEFLHFLPPGKKPNTASPKQTNKSDLSTLKESTSHTYSRTYFTRAYQVLPVLCTGSNNKVQRIRLIYDTTLHTQMLSNLLQRAQQPFKKKTTTKPKKPPRKYSGTQIVFSG